MLDHVGFQVAPSKFDSIVAWYLAALAPLGYEKQMEIPGKAVGLGPSKDSAPFWIAVKESASDSPSLHLAFKAKDHDMVQKFHTEAVKAGGKCNGKPGPRAYHPSYYAAFVLDPLGNNIEVVDHVPHD
ncbi:hypothetical protein BP6252_11413 [Coleophoma cylindrospora]|uniref:VOC domain-containing protein n=1 Tax=Coleophoma cylindrospora TaxID=1849047 RepID=A0A3D8QJY2_9HELO|nr:hypothetical protein BP6252_11413 [Coleophoma cylindrospora]